MCPEPSRRPGHCQRSLGKAPRPALRLFWVCKHGEQGHSSAFHCLDQSAYPSCKILHLDSPPPACAMLIARALTRRQCAKAPREGITYAKQKFFDWINGGGTSSSCRVRNSRPRGRTARKGDAYLQL